MSEIKVNTDSLKDTEKVLPMPASTITPDQVKEVTKLAVSVVKSLSGFLPEQYKQLLLVVIPYVESAMENEFILSLVVKLLNLAKQGKEEEFRQVISGMVGV